jgi:putative lipase involved disintegration of autophagic bodies
LTVVRWSIALFIGIVLAYEFTSRGVSEIALAFEMINMGSRVYPNNLVTGTGHARGGTLAGGLSRRHGLRQADLDCDGRHNTKKLDKHLAPFNRE